ncbi:MAG: TlpA family protein disulfide reductase [Acidobacteria bacterium]|nr:TlpA family protein disulfide reductase [Acidobacteriota bacterium]
MISTKQTEARKTFWTIPRAALTALSAALVLFVASSCTSNDISTETPSNNSNAVAGKQPSVTVTQQPPQQRPPQATTGPAESLPAEVLNAEIQDIEGKTFHLSDYGDKVVVLDLWATWCGPCRLEIPHLVELSKEYGSKGVQVIGLTTEDPQQAQQTVRDFMREFKINYPVGWAKREMSIALMRGNYSIPQTFVIAPGGRIVAHYRGYSDSIPAMIRAAVDKAKEPTGD